MSNETFGISPRYAQYKANLVKTYFNREEHPCNYETNDLPSETVPDQTMSIRTILDRYARGLPVGGQLTPEWQEDDEYNDLPDPRTLDLAERQELKEQFTSELSELKKQYPKKTRPVGDETHKGNEVTDTPSGKTADGTEAQKQSLEKA